MYSEVKVVIQSAEVILQYRNIEMITLMSITLVDCCQRKDTYLCNLTVQCFPWYRLVK